MYNTYSSSNPQLIQPQNTQSFILGNLSDSEIEYKYHEHELREAVDRIYRLQTDPNLHSLMQNLSQSQNIEYQKMSKMPLQNDSVDIHVISDENKRLELERLRTIKAKNQKLLQSVLDLRKQLIKRDRERPVNNIQIIPERKQISEKVFSEIRRCRDSLSNKITFLRNRREVSSPEDLLSQFQHFQSVSPTSLSRKMNESEKQIAESIEAGINLTERYIRKTKYEFNQISKHL